MNSRVLVTAGHTGCGRICAALAVAQELGASVRFVEPEPATERLISHVEPPSAAGAIGARVLGRLAAELGLVWRPKALDPSRPDRTTQRVRRALTDREVERIVDGLPLATRQVITTVPSVALALDGVREMQVSCLVADGEVSRAVAPLDGRHSRLRYLAATRNVAERLVTFGVPEGRVHYTGLPLPAALLGGPELSAVTTAFKARLLRLDPKRELIRAESEALSLALGSPPESQDRQPPRVTVVVGGCRAQVREQERVLEALSGQAARGQVRLGLVAEPEAGPVATVRRWLDGRIDAQDGSRVQSVACEEPVAFYRGLVDLLADTDVVCSRPSDLLPFAALGLPFLLTRPNGYLESCNRRWLVKRGAARSLGAECGAWECIEHWLDNGTLASLAWSGYRKIRKHGLYQVTALVVKASEQD